MAEAGAATWQIPKGSQLSTSTSSFTASVQRLACNGGVTGTVREPRVDYSDSRVILTFEVDGAASGAGDCQGNRAVRYEVVLSEPLGGRELVDGACLAGGEARTTAYCLPDGVRWP